MKSQKNKPLTPQNNRVLLIESDDELRASIIRLLKKQKFEIFSTESDNHAKEYLDKNQVGCIIFGLNQPLNKSLQKLKKVIDHNQNPCILILSSFDWQEVETQIGDIRYSEFVIKPIKQEEFMKIITRLSNKKKS